MKRTIAGVAVALALSGTTASAQGIGLGVGTLVPQGELADGAKSGLAAIASFEFGRSALAFRLEALWANSDLDGAIIEDGDDFPIPDDADVSGDVKFVGGLGSVVFHLGTAAIRPYVLGGLGYYNRSVAQEADDAAGDLIEFDSDETVIGYHFGAGVKLKLGPLGIFGEARYHIVDTDEANTRFVPILVGIRLGS
jgi:hypothetical protein